MPPIVAAIATAVSYVVSIGGIYQAAGIAAYSFTASLLTATGVGWSLARAALAYTISRGLSPKPKLSSIRSSPMQIMVQGTSESHRIIYGEAQEGGVFYPLGKSGTNGEYLHFVLVYARHECNSFGTMNVNGEAVTIDGSGNVTSGKWSGLMRVKSHLGAWNQTVDTDLQTDMGAPFWPSTAKGGNVAYDYFRLKADSTVASIGVPSITRLIQGRKVYDWRDVGQDPDDPDTWVWSANWALCVADWVMGVPMKNGAGNVVRNYGFRAPVANVSDADVIEAANISDEDVALAGGGTEKRYTCNGIVQVSAARGDVLDAMRTAGAGDVLPLGDKWVIRAGAYRSPTVTLTEDDFRAAITGLQVKPSGRDLANGVKGTFTSPESNWQAADFPAYTKRIPAANLVNGDRVMIVTAGSTTWTAIGAADNNVGTIFTATGAGSGTGYAEAYIVEDGGERLWLDLEFPFTTSAATAQRISKIRLEQIRQSISFEGHYKLTALQNQPTDVVGQTFGILGWSAKAFRIEDFKPVIESTPDGAPVIGCDVVMRETASGVYDWGTGDERAYDVAPNTSLPNPLTVADPTSLSVTSSSSTVLIDGANVIARLLASWTAPADIYVISGGHIRVEYKEHSSGTWLAWTLTRGDQTTEYVSDVKVGVSYDLRIRSENSLDVPGAWVTQSSITAVGLGTPSTPTGLAISTTAASMAGAPPRFVPTTSSKMLAFKLSWTANANAEHIDHYEIRTDTLTGSTGPYDDLNVRTKGNETEIWIYVAVGFGTTSSDVRAVNKAGTAGSYCTAVVGAGTASYGTQNMAEQAKTAVDITGGTIVGITDLALADGGTAASTAAGARTNLGVTATGADTNYNARSSNLSDVASASTARTNLGLGSIATQNTTAVNISSLKVGAAGASSIKEVLAIFDSSEVANLTGGAPSETFNVSLSNAGFGTKPDVGAVEMSDSIDPNMVAVYDYGAAGSTSTNAVVRVSTVDGTNLGAGLRRFSVMLKEYN